MPPGELAVAVKRFSLRERPQMHGCHADQINPRGRASAHNTGPALQAHLTLLRESCSIRDALTQSSIHMRLCL